MGNGTGKECLETCEPHAEGVTRRNCGLCKAVRARHWRQTAKGHASCAARNEALKRHAGYGAKQEVFKAVRDGRLPKVNSLDCVDCGAMAQCYDHRDYALPLAVVPVCRRCNWLRGAAL